LRSELRRLAGSVQQHGFELGFELDDLRRNSRNAKENAFDDRRNAAMLGDDNLGFQFAYGHGFPQASERAVAT